METTKRGSGIIRRIDDLGRIVIPKEIRRTLHIREGDPFEIFVGDNEVTFRKYSPMGPLLQSARPWIDALAKKTGHRCLFCDTSQVIYASNGAKALNEVMLSDAFIAQMRQRKVWTYSPETDKPIYVMEPDRLPFYVTYINPIIAKGELIGAICFVSDSTNHTWVSGINEDLADMIAQIIANEYE